VVKGLILLKHPYAYYLNDYERFVFGHFGELTIKNRIRRLNQLKRIIYDFHDKGMVSTVSPRLLTVDDLVVIIGYRKSKVSVETVLDDIAFLEGFLVFCDNDAVDKFREKYPRFVPKAKHKRKPPMPYEQFQRILERADNVDSDDFIRMRAYGVVVFCLCGGLRTLEIQHARVSNLVIEESGIKLWLDVVKGGKTYGDPRWIAILPAGREFVERYLLSRSKQLKSLNLVSDSLIPPLLENVTFTSDKNLRKLKDYVSREVGFNFDLRMCRRTYGQFLVDSEVPFECVQVALGHNDPKTTYKNYAGVRTERVPDLVFKRLLNKQKGGE